MRACTAADRPAILAIVNAAAEVYRGVIPDDCWHEPYMSEDELAREVGAGVEFSGWEEDGALVGVMGMQRVRDVHLVRHAYVLPSHQGRGIGGHLLASLASRTDRILIGTWADATWAIRFYERHGFVLVPDPERGELLRRYWTISPRQLETSVVLSNGAPRGN